MKAREHVCDELAGEDAELAQHKESLWVLEVARSDYYSQELRGVKFCPMCGTKLE